MKKIKYVILTIIFIIFIINIDIVITSVKSASIIFFNKVFVSIFPFIILSDILYYYNYHLFLKDNIGALISKIFNINSKSSSIFLLCLFTSHPGNAIYIKNMLDNDEISLNDASNLLCYTYFPSIAFVIGTIGISLYGSYRFGLYLYLICLINNILIGIFLRNKNDNIDSDIVINNNSNIFDVISNSIMKGINTSFIILGTLIIFTIIINLILRYVNINPYILGIFSGILELTSGVIKISDISNSINNKFLLTVFILCFSSLSILFQSFTILSKYKINIKKILIVKLIFSIISTFIIYLITLI